MSWQGSPQGDKICTCHCRQLREANILTMHFDISWICCSLAQLQSLHVCGSMLTPGQVCYHLPVMSLCFSHSVSCCKARPLCGCQGSLLDMSSFIYLLCWPWGLQACSNCAPGIYMNTWPESSLELQMLHSTLQWTLSPRSCIFGEMTTTQNVKI